MTQRKPYEEGARLAEDGRYPEAIAVLEACLERLAPGEPDERVARHHLGEAVVRYALQLAGAALDESIPQLQAALRFHPEYADLHFQLGGQYLLRGFFSDARVCFDRALAINPGFARAVVLRGVVQYAMGDHEAAFAEIERGLARDERIDRRNFDDAVVLHGRGATATALEKMLLLVSSFGDRANKIAAIAKDHYRAGRFREAVEMYRKALSIAPNYPDLRNHLGVALFALDRPDLALVEFSRAVEINPKYVAAQFNRAQAFLRIGREAEGRTALQQVLELDPQFEAARTALDQLRSAA